MSGEHDTGRRLRDAYSQRGGVTSVFSSRVADYVASRPGYPAALFERLHVLAGMRPGTRVADVGAGSGCLTRGLLERGYRVIAVEPNPDMRAAADALLAGLPAYRGVAGSAEDTGLADAAVDLVTAAQAFHWFDADPARREFLRILAPGGKVALIRNDRLLADPLHVALDRVLHGWGGSLREALSAHEEGRRFVDFFAGAPIQHIDLPHEQRLDRSGLLSLVFSRSYMPGRDTAEAAQVAHQVQAVFDAFAREGSVTVRYRTVAIVGCPASR